MAVALLALLLQPAQDSELARNVAALVTRLGSDDVAVREQATEELIRLGPEAEPLVAAALSKADDAEVKARLEAVLQVYAPQREEAYALKCLREKRVFPKGTKSPGRGEIEVNATIADAVEHIAETFGLKIELYADDAALKEKAKEARLKVTASSPTAEYLLFTAVTEQFEHTYVIDGDRIVIVRLTPAILFERLGLDGDVRDEFQEQRKLRYFGEPERREYWTTMNRFIQAQAGRGHSREKWVAVLAAAAQDAKGGVEFRRSAIRAMRSLYGAEAEFQPDSTDVLIRLFADAKAPPEVRAEAAAALAECSEDDGVETVLTILEGGDRAYQSALLHSLGATAHRGIAALPRILVDEDRKARFDGSLKSLSASKEAEIAGRATALRVLVGDYEAVKPLCGSPTSWMVIGALRSAAFHDFASVRERLEALAKDESATWRAAAALVYGRRAGGQGRAEDVAGATRLLDDAEPIVRWAAAHSLGITYSSNAAEKYRDGLAECRAKLKAALEKEIDARVRAQIEAALKGLIVE